MKFRRLSDGQIFDARCWQRHGDHPVVRPASSADLPSSTSPGAYGWLDGSGIVLPGDWILTDANGTPRVVLERSFRKDFEPVPELLPSSDNPPRP